MTATLRPCFGSYAKYKIAMAPAQGSRHIGAAFDIGTPASSLALTLFGNGFLVYAPACQQRLKTEHDQRVKMEHEMGR